MIARGLARLRARIFGRTYKLTYHHNSSGLVFISHPEPISSHEAAAFEKMKQHVKDRPDDDLTITIKTPWGAKVGYAADPANDLEARELKGWVRITAHEMATALLKLPPKERSQEQLLGDLTFIRDLLHNNSLAADRILEERVHLLRLRP